MNYKNGCPKCNSETKLVCFDNGGKWCCSNHVCGWQEGQKEQTSTGKLHAFLDSLTHDDLRTLRAIINGKLSKRVITPEQQAKMQAARKPTSTPR